MKCRDIRHWLLTADGTSSVPSGVRRHLYECARCRRQRQRLLKLDGAVRQLPAPAANPAARAQLWERIGFTQPEPAPAVVPMAARRPQRLWLRWASAAALLIAAVWLSARYFLPPRHETPTPAPALVADGRQFWIAPEDRATVLRVARHDARLAETTDPVVQFGVLTTMAGDLKDDVLRVVRDGKPGNLPLLTSLYDAVVRQGIVDRAAALPADKKAELIGSMARRLQATDAEMEAATRDALPVVVEMVQPLRSAARESATRLSNPRALVPALPMLAVGPGPTPLLTVLVHQGIRLARESDHLRRADLSAELASYLAPAVVLLNNSAAAADAQVLTSCMGELLEHGVADNLDQAAAEQGLNESDPEAAKVRQRAAQTVALLEQNMAKVPEASRSGLQKALDTARSGNERVRDSGKKRPAGKVGD